MKKFGTLSFVVLVIATLFMLGVTPPSVAADDSIVTVSMSGLTFVGAGGTEKVSISFNWDVTTNTIVPGTVSTSSSGVIGESFDAFISYGSVVGGEGFLFQDNSVDRVSVNTCGFDCGTFPSVGTYNTIDVTLLCGPSDSCSAAGLNGLHPSSGAFTVSNAVYSFNLIGPQSSTNVSNHTITLTGGGSFDVTAGTVVASGSFTTINNSNGEVIHRGTWRATAFTSFCPRGGPDSGHQGGVLVITITLFPDGGNPIAGLTMTVNCLIGSGCNPPGEGVTVGDFTTIKRGATLFHLND